MNSTDQTSTLSPNNSTINQSLFHKTPAAGSSHEYHTALIVIYSVVLLSGTISLSLMIHIMKSSTTSITSITVLNLIFAHFIFLLTVPFRIYYYATDYWSMSVGWCKVVSSMIHIHMYMSFLLYVIILVTRLMAFYRNTECATSFRRIHVFLASAVLWLVVLVMGPLIICFAYGNDKNETHCFNFGKDMRSTRALSFNYTVSTLIILVATVLTALQANALRVLYRKHSSGCTSQQDFGAQLKSLLFALIMVVCFIPYHIFRFRYLEDEELEPINEVFLALTTFNCLDMLTFLGRRTFYMCLPRKVR